MPVEPLPAGHAETASHPAPRLGRYAECSPVLIRDHDSLHGAGLRAADLRGGAALVVAALGAEGRSELTGLDHIDRGYQELEATLRSLGADITRTGEPLQNL